MNTALYNCIRKKYGKHASWALWDGKNTGEWADREYRQIINSGRKLNPNIVMVGLNASADVSVTEEDLFSNFHDPKNPRIMDMLRKKRNTLGNARKLPYVFNGWKKYEGAYMTDIIKLDTINEIDRKKLSSSADIMKYLRKHPEIWEKNINSFWKELECIGATKPLIIAFGNNVSVVLDGPGKKFKIKHPSRRRTIRIPHYSKWGNRESYRKEVEKILK